MLLLATQVKQTSAPLLIDDKAIFNRSSFAYCSNRNRRISFVNNGWRELKETPSSNWKIPCQAIIDHRAIEISVSTNHVWRERKETTRVNFRRNAKLHTTKLVKSRNSKQQIHRKHCLLKNKIYKHVNGGSSECTAILSVMYDRNVTGRSFLITETFSFVSVVFDAIHILL
ncbi:hypothetical protein T01_10136 [Trichinella spiralis]|uniref:Uncharacterized protein n=1 Tax=Trichinella spiralis TaxID=6334 RepID=A0A0V1BA24_TRISP|nr:hypothetical protein T01_10136 [Trichinella spiralis]